MSTTYRFEWRQIVVEPFLAELAAAAGVSSIRREEVVALLARIFAGTGGAALAYSDWDVGHRAQVARKLLGEAIGSVLTHRFAFKGRALGVVTRKNHGAQIADSMALVDVNRADRDQLEALPVIGPALADSIIEERRSRGCFRSLPDLLQRIKGLGDEAGEQLQGVLAFSEEGLPLRPVVGGILEDDLRAMLALRLDAPRRDPLEAALEEVAMHVAGYPHPQARMRTKRDDLEPGVIATVPEAETRAGRVAVLADNAYYASMVDLIRRAAHRVDVCMFYIALPVQTHPTHELLEALAGKVAEGRVVRVLVDQDGKGDPYGSRLINAAAVAFLSSRGVDVRADPTETLLHSKFVLVDDDKVAIGSHNWTAGSFFRYADVSVLLSGTATAQRWRSRFETLWARGRKFEDGHGDVVVDRTPPSSSRS